MQSPTGEQRGRSRAQPSSNWLLRCILSYRGRCRHPYHRTGNEPNWDTRYSGRSKETERACVGKDQERHHARVGSGSLGGILIQMGKEGSFRDGEATRGRVKGQWKGRNSNSSATEIISCVTSCGLVTQASWTLVFSLGKWNQWQPPLQCCC